MKDKIAIIGAGMMGSALIKSLIKGKYEGKITASDVMSDKLLELEKIGVNVTSNNREAASEADIVIVAVKPGDLEKVLKDLNNELKDKTLISVAATVPLKFLQTLSGFTQRSHHA
jgi:pyrroline-5-carboxylate reductase